MATRAIASAFLPSFIASLKALAGRATEVLSEAMNDGKNADAIAAAREVFKLNDRYPKDDTSKDDGQNAADIVKQVVDLARDFVNVRRVERHPQAQIIDNDDSLIEGET